MSRADRPDVTAARMSAHVARRERQSVAAAPDVTALLRAWCEGSGQARAELIPLVYDELRRIAHRQLRRERAEHLFQTTAVVHEVYLRLVDQDRANFRNRDQFFAVCARLMRRILVDASRRRRAAKREGAAVHVPLDEAAVLAPSAAPEILAVHEALVALSALDSRKCQIVELRFFGGLTIAETARVLGCSPATVEREWSAARAWLYREISRGTAPA